METLEFCLDTDSKMPKYEQFIYVLQQKIAEGELKVGQRLPSIVDSSISYGLSRDTVLRAYKELYKRGSITSVYRKGYFVSRSTKDRHKKQVLVLASASTSANHVFYQNLSGAMEENDMQCDYKVYHNDLEQLEHVINETTGNYHTYIVEPQMLSLDKVMNLLENMVCCDKIMVLNDSNIDLGLCKRQIFFNVENDLFLSLKKLSVSLERYDTLNLVLPAKEYFPYKAINGFFNFCDAHSKTGNILEELTEVERNCAYLLMDEKTLFRFLNEVEDHKMSLGNEVGLLTLFERQYLQFLNKRVTSLNWFHKGLARSIVTSIKDNVRDSLPCEAELNLRESL